MKKRVLPLLLALVLCLGLLPATALAAGAASGECGEYAVWSLDKSSGTLTISGTGSMDMFWEAAYEVDDPSAIRNVVINEGITYISECAFLDCTNVVNVTIPQSVTCVGADAFTGTLWLKSLGEFAIVNGMLLKYQGNQTNVVIPNGVTSIAPGAFYGNEAITSVTIPEGVVSIGAGDMFGYVFWGCTNLASITFPSTLREIGRFSFLGTKWMNDQKGDFVTAGNILVLYQGAGNTLEHDIEAPVPVVIPDGIAYVADGAFQESWISTLTVPASMIDLNEISFFMVPPDYLPTEIVYKGTQAQWDQVKGTEWITDPVLKEDFNKIINVRCTGTTDPTPTPTPAAPDLSGLPEWAKASVGKAIEQGLVPQELQGNYEQVTTRAQFCALAVKLYESARGEITGRETFTDTNDVNVQKMASLGVVAGVGAGKFNPDGPLTREQAASILARLANAMGKPFPSGPHPFTDGVSAWADTAVGQAYQAGIMAGTGDTTFDPQGEYTRMQSIATIMRLYDLVNQ